MQRHLHSKGSTIFAYAHELDDWLASRVARAERREPAGPPKPPSPELSPLPAAAAVAADAGSGGMAFRLVAVSSMAALVMAATALVLHLSAEDPVDPLDRWIRQIPVEQRLLLEASYFESRGNHVAALRAFEAVVGVGPIGREAVAAAERSCEALGEDVRCAQLVRHAADQSPEDATLQAMAAVAVSRSSVDLTEGMVYAERARVLAERTEATLDPELLAFVELLPARKAWLDEDIVRSVGELDRLAKRAADLPGDGLDAVARAAGQHCLALGKIDCAEKWFSRVADPAERYELQGYSLFAAGRMEDLGTHLAGGDDYRWPETAILLALTGNPEAAEKLVNGLDTTDAATLQLVRGGLDLIAGEPAQAGPLLASGLSSIRPAGVGVHFIGLDMLSRIAEATGQLDRAAELLEMTGEQRKHAILLGSGLFWIKCQTRLAEVYRGMEREEDALLVERELLTALALSDADHPTTAALRRRSA